MSNIKLIGNGFMDVELIDSTTVVLKCGDPENPTAAKYSIRISKVELKNVIDLLMEAQRVFGMTPASIKPPYSGTPRGSILDQARIAYPPYTTCQNVDLNARVNNYGDS